MEQDNFISYLSMGQDTFSCEFKVRHEEQIEVIVEETILEYLNDYIIENFQEKTKVIKLKEKLGSTLYPKLLILKRNPDVKRTTDFKDDTQIKANLLNLEFNNVIDNQQYLNDFLIKLSEGFEARKKDDGEGEKPIPEGFLDPRKWKEAVHILDLENGFNGVGFYEIPMEDPMPFTHNIYFAYAKNTNKFPNELIYRFTNFAEMKEPFSIKFIIDKRICFAKIGEENRKKIYAILNLGDMYAEDFYIYSNNQDVITEGMIKGTSIKKKYKSIYEQLNMIDDDIFIIKEKYYMDPLRGL